MRTGLFKPDRNITRAEAVTLVNRTLDRHPDKNHFTKDMLVWPDNMDQTKWYYADMQEATNSHTYQMKENSDKTKYENWTKTLPIRNWEALEKAWSNANSSQGTGTWCKDRFERSLTQFRTENLWEGDQMGSPS